MLGTSLLWRSTVEFTYLKVKFVKCLCLLPAVSVLVLRIRSCLHHWQISPPDFVDSPMKITVERLEVGTNNMCLTSDSRYRPFISPPQFLGNLLLYMFNFIPVSFSFFAIFRVRLGGLSLWFRFGIGNLKHLIAGAPGTVVGPVRQGLGLPTVPEWPGSSRNWPTASRVPGEAHFVPEMWKLTTGHHGMHIWLFTNECVVFCIVFCIVFVSHTRLDLTWVWCHWLMRSSLYV